MVDKHVCMYDNLYLCQISVCVLLQSAVCVRGWMCVCGKSLPGTESHYEHKQPVEAGVKDVFIQKIPLSPPLAPFLHLCRSFRASFPFSRIVSEASMRDFSTISGEII